MLEAVLRLDGVLRERLAPLQAGTILFVQRHPDAKVKETAEALAIRLPTLSPTLKKLVRKRLLTGQRPSHNERAVYLNLTPQSEALARKILVRIRGLQSLLLLK